VFLFQFSTISLRRYSASEVTLSGSATCTRVIAVNNPDQHPRGIDQFCLGIDQYQPKRVVADLRRDFPDAEARLERGEQVYLRDPDGATVQLCPTDYRR
jgi:hypothetical protein